MRNSDRFLAAFNSIEKALKSYSNREYYVAFSKLLGFASKSNSVIRRYKDDLKEFAELRNAIVHESTDPNYAIAEPHDSIVEKIEIIEREIFHPDKVIPRFSKKVVTFQLKNTVAELLRAIRIHGFTQFPIYDEKQFVGLLIDKDIVFWLAKRVGGTCQSFYDLILADVLDHSKRTDNYEFIASDSNIYDVKEIFRNTKIGVSGLDALLITHNGIDSEPLLGIITPVDVINIP